MCDKITMEAKDININNKITCITMFDKHSLDKINAYINDIDFKLCKLKYDEKTERIKIYCHFIQQYVYGKIKIIQK